MLLLLFLFVLIPCKCKVGGLNNISLEADFFGFPPSSSFFLFPFFFATRHVAEYEHLFFFFFFIITPKSQKKRKENTPLLLQPHLPSKRSPSSKIPSRSFTPLRRRIRSASCRSSWNKSPLENHHCALQRKKMLADGYKTSLSLVCLSYKD